MQIELIELLGDATGLVAGLFIGLGFGAIQEAAARRNQRMENSGKFSSGWAAMPGSMRRVAYLLMALAGVQLICPLLFRNGSEWWISAGVVAGYGWALFRKLRETLAARRQ